MSIVYSATFDAAGQSSDGDFIFKDGCQFLGGLAGGSLGGAVASIPLGIVGASAGGAACGLITAPSASVGCVLARTIFFTPNPTQNGLHPTLFQPPLPYACHTRAIRLEYACHTRRKWRFRRSAPPKVAPGRLDAVTEFPTSSPCALSPPISARLRPRLGRSARLRPMGLRVCHWTAPR